MVEERWFVGNADEWTAIAEQLKQTLVRTARRSAHWSSMASCTDSTRPARGKRPCARRVFCSNRQARPGCGRTFSVWLADKIKRLSLTARALWQFLQVAVVGGILAASRTLDCPLSDRTMQRVWKRFDRAQSKIRTALCGRCPPPESPAPPPANPAHQPAAASARPSPSRLPQCQLPDRRLPANHACLLRVGPVRSRIARIAAVGVP